MPDLPILPGSADKGAESPEPRPVSAERVEALLANGDVTTARPSRLWGSNYSALVAVKDEELHVTAVYKPQRGERPLWDFPDGTLCYREVASYYVSQALGWLLVPPTVLRDGPQGLGSLQLFIEHDPEMNYFSLDDRFVAQLQRFALFDSLINNTDRKGGHLLLDPRSKLWGIDHGLTFHIVRKLRTVIWEFVGQRVADEMQQDIQRLCEELNTTGSALLCKLAPLLSTAEIAALKRRVDAQLENRCFPNPGPGPNHPWPPI